MSTPIPNVSSIFRDLSHISSHLSQSQSPNNPPPNSNYNTNNNTNNYSLENRSKNNQPTPFEDLYAYKQKRHNQLMARLRNSSEEHCRIVGGVQSLGGNGGNNYNNAYSGSSSQYQYQPAQYSSTSSNNYGYGSGNSGSGLKVSQTRGMQRSTGNGYVMPKIRYRHIQDQQSKISNIDVPPLSPIKEGREYQQLQQQFYQDITSNLIKNPNQKPTTNNANQNSQIGIQTNPNLSKNAQIMDQQDLDQRSQISNRTGNLNNRSRTRNGSKYEDKIESYYELCRKNLGTIGEQAGKEKEKEREKEGKYMRATGGKNKVMKLDQAIKLLSLD